MSDVRLSKFLSRVLRHEPALVGITLDPAGWARVDELVARATAASYPVTRAELAHIVATDVKQRFRLSDDGDRIRASQGHSVPVDLGLASVAPPEHLYHGTAQQFVRAILARGLKPQQRLHVHLSQDVDTALAVGRRRGRPVVLVVAARALHASGHPFWRADNGVWLTSDVPPHHVERLSP